MQVSGEATPVRVVATVFGFVVLVLLLSGLNATLFQGAPEGTWRKRIPSIFLDVARFALIAVGVGLVFAYIWGANVGGLFTALGVSSIVLGLALQNSVGQIISGLLVLFEQPFQLGDWIDTPSARGRVVEVNWRATHIDTGSGLHDHAELRARRSVVHQPQSAARSPFPHRHHVVFARRPAGRRLRDVERGWPAPCRSCDRTRCRQRCRPAASRTRRRYHCERRPTTSPPNRCSSGGSGTRRVAPDYISTRPRTSSPTPERTEDSLRIIAPTLRLTHAEQQKLLPHVRLMRYGDRRVHPIRRAGAEADDVRGERPGPACGFR